MQSCIIYHHPKCSKSRQALELLKGYGINPTIIEYLNEPLNWNQLINLSSHFTLKDFVRTNETVFKQLRLNLEDKESVLRAMLQEPILMQRPIVIYDGVAIIARPPEALHGLIK